MRIELGSSFGYPVLRPDSDDYVGCAIQSSLNASVESDLSTINVSYSIKISVPELNKLIDEGKAALLIYGECRDTWYDVTHYPKEEQGEFPIPKNAIDGHLVLTCLVVAKSEIKDYRSSKFNEEYGQSGFNIQAGEILAYDNPQSFYISREAFKNVTSLFDYRENQNLAVGEWDVSLDDARIKIDVHPAQLPILRSAEATAKNKAVLLAGLFLPVLIQILNTMESSPDEFEDYHWYQIIQDKRSRLASSVAKSVARSAQALLRQPLARLNTNMGWEDEN